MPILATPRSRSPDEARSPRGFPPIDDGCSNDHATPIKCGWTQRASEDWNAWARAHASGAEKATFLALDGERALGIAAGMRDADDATRFGLFSMWVAPEARRRGVGRALVDDVIAFYETCAFVDDGRREPLVHTPTVIEVGMTRLLSPTRTVARRNESSRS